MKTFYVQVKFEASIEVKEKSADAAKRMVQSFLMDEMAEHPVVVPGYDRTERFVLEGGEVTDVFQEEVEVG